MDSKVARLVFDSAHAEAMLDELSLRLKAFNSFELVPDEVRSMIEESLSGSGLEFAHLDDGTTTGAGERFLKVRIVGRLERALSTLRAMQGDVVGHAVISTS